MVSRALCRVSQLWSRSALILQTWFSLSVFQAPRKMLAALFTWQIPSQPNRARGGDTVWIVDSSNLWSAFHMHPSELNALPLLCLLSHLTGRMWCCTWPLSRLSPCLCLCLIVELFHRSTLIVHSVAYSTPTPPPCRAWEKRTARYWNC